jgi:hypothetical protein
MTPKSPDASLPTSPRIACYGTAFLADAPVDAKLLMRGIAAEVPQFGSPRLDASFLINCGSVSQRQAGDNGNRTYVKRVAGADFHSPEATVVYECSTELRGLLAALTAERATQMACEWYGMYGPQKSEQAETNGRRQRRLEILKNLAAVALQGKDRQTKLMLRVDYRKQS